MNKILRILKWFFYALRGVMTYIIPKKYNFYAILPSADKNNFAGNCKAIALYLKVNCPNTRFVILSDSRIVIGRALELGYKSWNLYSLRGVWSILRARFIFIDSNRIDFFLGKYDIIQLWHGIGFKNVALLNDHPEVNKQRLIKNYNKYKLILASSETNLIQQNESFGSNKSKITGYPRNDFFFNEKININKYKSKFNLLKYDRIYTYAPTFRDSYTCMPFSEYILDKLEIFLRDSNSILIIKKHPDDIFLNITNKYKYIVDLSSFIKDIQELLLISDVLISDYSSVSTDFVLMDKPLIIYAYDYDDYLINCRSMYYPLEEVLPKPIVRNETELLDAIMDLSWFSTNEIIDSYQKFKGKFHEFIDGNSSKRVMNLIEHIDNKKYIKRK